MRFDFLNLRAFGHFTEYELVFNQSKSFHLLYGPNEAGKSTTLRSITHLLYGFPQQTSDSFLHTNSKLRIEGQLKKNSGEVLHFVRRKGIKNTILDPSGNTLDDNVVNTFLQGISEEQFLNMFALDHVRLREGGESLLQSGGNLGESLFSAASGINMLRTVFEDLEKKSGELFKKRGSTPEINKLLKEEKDLRKKIMDNQLKIQAWKDLERTYSEGKKQTDNIRLKVRELQSNLEKLQRLKITLPKIAKQKELHQKLTNLGIVPTLQENAVELRKESQLELDRAVNDRKKAESDSAELLLEIEKIKIPTGIVEQELVIDSLYREVQSYQNNMKRIPKLEGESRILEDRVLSMMKEIDPDHADLQNIDSYRIPAVKKETIRELCKEKPLLDQRLLEIEKQRKSILDELLVKKEELSKIPEVPNTDELENMIDVVKRAGDIDTALSSLLSEYTLKESQINEAVDQLPLWNGPYKDLLKLEIPRLTETIKKFEQEHFELVQRLQRLRDSIDVQKELINQHEEKIRELESLAEIPSEEKLLSVRTNRDQEWKLIREQLHRKLTSQEAMDFSKGEPNEGNFEKSIQDADNIADKMRFEAAKVGEKNKRLSDIDSCKKKIVELQSEEQIILKDLASWDSAWLHLWEPSTLIPLTPGEMNEWLGKYEHIKMLVKENEKAKKTLIDLENKRNQLQIGLTSALSALVHLPKEHTIQELLRIAENHFKKIQTVREDLKSLSTGIIDIEGRLKTNEAQRIEINDEVNEWNKKWSEAIQNTNISKNISVKVAESILSKYEELSRSYAELKRIEKDSHSLTIQITQFKESVFSLLHSIDLKIGLESADLIVNHLHAALQNAKEDQINRINLTKQLDRQKEIIKDAKEREDKANSVIGNLLNAANCSNLQELIEVENMISLRNEYVEELQEIEEELILNGNGLSLQDILEEAKEVAHDTIRIEIDEIKRQLDDIEPLQSQLEQDYGVVKKEYEEKVKGNSISTIEAEQEKESLFSQLANVVDQYVNLKLASALLQRGIEHYRNQNQDPILSRASELFARLTLQSFTGLQVDYDEKDQPVLMGVRTSGEKVPVAGMSDGSTDQLYLALRIASIEKFSKENEPIPFIVDDILVHFDDTRSKETLKILVELSKKTQIIFFTHHARLVEIMKEIAHESEYELMEISHKESVVV
jgi:uncharacterized protein YhaN